jgi:hypothetical protein
MKGGIQAAILVQSREIRPGDHSGLCEKASNDNFAIGLDGHRIYGSADIRVKSIGCASGLAPRSKLRGKQEKSQKPRRESPSAGDNHGSQRGQANGPENPARAVVGAMRRVCFTPDAAAARVCVQLKNP